MTYLVYQLELIHLTCLSQPCYTVVETKKSFQTFVMSEMGVVYVGQESFLR